ncbi:MAG: FG-GAP-like repeat-containing protein, partial [Planctomycetota bacterium]|nr:FG-GAP-like repeat-containing protein [Planctomycetota bacterium]
MTVARWPLRVVLFFAVGSLASPLLPGADGNRLTYLDEHDPYYVSRDFPRLITPQWVGEEGVDAVVILAIDDMRSTEPYERYLGPILTRLKEIDGRAPVSIMTNRLEPDAPILQKWLTEGLSLECHTLDHPCPLLRGGDFAKAKATYDGCVDLLSSVPGNEPVAFRMPCMDSRNTPSPRFYAEIFNRTTPGGRFLRIDSSVCNVTTLDDPELPRELVVDADGRPRFRKYIPFPSFVNTVENYPYPYVLGKLCWQFPCVVPSDWEAQNLHGVNHAVTVRDLQAQIDVTVIKQGTFTLVFHPHGWLRNDQVVQVVDHAVRRHGKRILFLNFREAAERLREHLLAGHPLRRADGGDNGVRLLDVDADGYLDVVVGNDEERLTRLWDPRRRTWKNLPFPCPLVAVNEEGERRETGVQFGVIRGDGQASAVVRNEDLVGAWHFDGRGWREDPEFFAGLELDGEPVLTRRAGRDQGVRLRDLDGDGRSEVVVGSPSRTAVFRRASETGRWTRLPFALPDGATIVDEEGRDAGLRFRDIDGDLRDDVVFSNTSRYSLSLFQSMDEGWSRKVLAGARDEGKDSDRAVDLPPITRNGTENGAWFHSR